jgi:hypothetical protein
MGNFRYWRKMTWVLLLWSAGALVFVVANGFGLSAIAIALLGVIVIGSIWYMSRAPWRVGHGARLRQMRSVEIPFRSPNTAAQD